MAATKTRKYALIDTNSYIYLFECGCKNPSFQRPPTDIKILEELIKLVKSGKLTILLPEITEIECTHKINSKKSELDTIFGKTITKIQDETVSDKKVISDETTKLIKDFILDLCDKEKNALDEVHKKYHELLSLKEVIRIPVDHTIFINAYKRGLLGKKPHSPKYNKDKQDSMLDNQVINDIQPDCLIIESALDFFNKSGVKNHEFYICTNDGHFYQNSEKTEIADSIKTDFNNVRAAHDLVELVSMIQNIPITPSTSPSPSPSPADSELVVNPEVQNPKQGVDEGLEKTTKDDIKH